MQQIYRRTFMPKVISVKLQRTPGGLLLQRSLPRLLTTANLQKQPAEIIKEGKRRYS